MIGEKNLAAMRALLRDPQISVREAANRLNLNLSTVYRKAPGLRSALEKR